MGSKLMLEEFLKIVSVCNQGGFFGLSSTKGIPVPVTSKPLGTLMRRNIKREWLLSLVNNADVHMFPLELSGQPVSEPLLLQSLQAASLLPGIIQSYLEISSSYRWVEPYGFGAYGSVSESVDKNAFQNDESFLQKLEARLWLCVVFFCSPKTASHWFNYWCRYRYRWWRKYSSLPSKFSMSEVMKPSTGDQQLELVLNCPWGKETIETITMLNPGLFDAVCSRAGFCEPSQSASPSMIMCQTELDRAALVYLINSLAEKWCDGEMRQVSQLHVKLTPYQVAFSFHCEREGFAKAKEVADHLTHELKRSRILVFPSSFKDSFYAFKRFDEMGVPYSIILDAKSLQSGIAGLRNRDSTLLSVNGADLSKKGMDPKRCKWNFVVPVLEAACVILC